METEGPDESYSNVNFVSVENGVVTNSNSKHRKGARILYNTRYFLHGLHADYRAANESTVEVDSSQQGVPLTVNEK